ncbi:MAG: RNA-binding protein [Helicobacteraceae bacterium]|jgi:RNA recognition motif-containing protein|nr:RNA-binding protein [Helicobacteraceae bacterium]MDR2034937.1 RNA-binding protein [Helicobacteraceae bacterium]
MKQLYVGNLPYNATEEQVRSVFAAYGAVNAVRMMTDRETGRFRGFGFVVMEDDDALKAVENLNGKDFGGRNLRVNEARERDERPPRREQRSW